jgi:acylphosphatase
VIALRLSVHGRVQGVFYRNWTVATARQLGLAGWVRNCDDGSVEALIQGEEAEVRHMVALMHDGPRAARVERIEELETAPETLTGFVRR